jgi:hypothetical protein
MGPVVMIITWQLRRGWRALGVLALAVALTTGFVMTAATGARRTASAWPRMRTHTKAPDIESWVYSGADALEAALRARPDAVATGQYAWMFVYPVLDSPLPPEGMYVALSDSVGRDIAAPIIVAGRAADPTKADELTLNEAYAQQLGLKPGARVELRSNPDTVVQTVTVVGIHRGTRDLNEDAGAASALLTPAFGHLWFQQYRDAFERASPDGYPTVVTARFAPGTDLDRVIADLRQKFPDQAPARVDDDSTALNDALSAQRTAYVLLAALGGVGALAALGQALSRRIKRSTDELSVLSVLGLSRWQRLVALLGAPLAASVVGGVLAPAFAYAASGAIPRGLARRVDPTPGRHVDLLVGTVGLGIVVVLLGLVGVTAAARAAAHREASAIASRRSTLIADPSQLFGLRVAVGWATRANRTSARSQIVGLMGVIALVAAVATWSASARHVNAQSQLWGWRWDATVEINEKKLSTTTTFVTSDTWPLISDLGKRLTDNDKVVSALATVQDGTVTIDGHQVEAAVIENSRGTIRPPLVRGRDALAPDEFDAGQDLINRAGWELGDQIPVGSTSLRLVGEIVSPTLGNGSFGQTAVMSPAALDRIGGFENWNSNYLFVDLAPGTTIPALSAAIGDQFDIVDPVPPSPVLGLRAIGGVDELLLGFITVVGAAALVHGVRSATRLRRRDHAVMRALGARSRFIALATAWHTGFVLGIGALVGIPLGWILGRLVWARTATGMGVVVEYASPVRTLATIVGALIAVGSLVAVTLGASAANRSSTRVLRQE